MPSGQSRRRATERSLQLPPVRTLKAGQKRVDPPEVPSVSLTESLTPPATRTPRDPNSNLREPEFEYTYDPGLTGKSLTEPLPPGEPSYQLLLFPLDPYSRKTQYMPRATTKAQRASVPPGMSFEHDPPLVRFHYDGPGGGKLPGYNLTARERRAQAESLQGGPPATLKQQKSQGGREAAFSKRMKKRWGMGKPRGR